MENWYTPDFNPVKAGWNKGLQPFGIDPCRLGPRGEHGLDRGNAKLGRLLDDEIGPCLFQRRKQEGQVRAVGLGAALRFCLQQQGLALEMVDDGVPFSIATVEDAHAITHP